MIKIYADGGCPGNGLRREGQGFASYKIYQDGILRLDQSRFPAGDTNNQAEFYAVLKALQDCEHLDLASDDLEICTDSELVAGALVLGYKITEPTLLDHLGKIRDILRRLFLKRGITVRWVPRATMLSIFGH